MQRWIEPGERVDDLGVELSAALRRLPSKHRDFRRTVLTISGSLRLQSFNARLLRAAESLAPAGTSFDHYSGLGELPHFSEDIEGELTPAAVHELRERIDRADCVLFSTPEYNGTIPGALKNALDWASRPPGKGAFKDKPAGAMGASPGRFGAQRAQADIRKVLMAIGAETLEAEFPVPRVHEKFDDAGALTDPETRAGLSEHVAALIALTDVPPPALDESAEYSLACQHMAEAVA